jgi:hypothetical protein
MIKIKLRNWQKGRNTHTFRPLIAFAQQFMDIGVQFVADGSYDIEFIGTSDILDKSIPLDQSIEIGLRNIENVTGDYCLFDGSDSTSLMGAYEVFEKSNAKYLFKPALTTQERYREPSAFNKWFFGTGSDLDLSYDIPDETFKRMKLTGWNLGYFDPNYLSFDTTNYKRDIDVCAIYQGFHKENSDHGARNDTFYTQHRVDAWNVLDTCSFSVERDKRPYEDFINTMRRSMCTLSPYGMGEICFRDFEIIQFGSVMVKPDMSLVNTYPNIYIPYETYVPCALDWSDLEEKIDWIKTHPNECRDITHNARQTMLKSYTVEKLLLYWYDILKTFEGVE